MAPGGPFQPYISITLYYSTNTPGIDLEKFKSLPPNARTATDSNLYPLTPAQVPQRLASR